MDVDPPHCPYPLYGVGFWYVMDGQSVIGLFFYYYYYLYALQGLFFFFFFLFTFLSGLWMKEGLVSFSYVSHTYLLVSSFPLPLFSSASMSSLVKIPFSQLGLFYFYFFLFPFSFKDEWTQTCNNNCIWSLNKAYSPYYCNPSLPLSRMKVRYLSRACISQASTTAQGRNHSHNTSQQQSKYNFI